MPIINEGHVAELNIVSCLIGDYAKELIFVGGEPGCSDAVFADIGDIIPIDNCPVSIDRVGDVVSEDW